MRGRIDRRGGCVRLEDLGGNDLTVSVENLRRKGDLGTRRRRCGRDTELANGDGQLIVRMKAAGVGADFQVPGVFEALDDACLEDQRQVVHPARVGKGRRFAVGGLLDDPLVVERNYRSRIGHRQLRIGQGTKAGEIFRRGQVEACRRRLRLAAGQPLEPLKNSIDLGGGARNSTKIDGILQGLERLTGGKAETAPTSFDLTAPKDFPGLGPLPDAQLAVPNPTAVIALDNQRIIEQTADGEAPAFPDARWVDNLPLVFQARIIQSFENAGYLKVGTDAGGLHADYQLAIAIRQFRIATAPAPASAQVAFAAKILDADGKIVAAKVFEANAPAPAVDTAAHSVSALDAAFGRATTDLIGWALGAINAAVAAAPPKVDAGMPPDLNA